MKTSVSVKLLFTKLSSDLVNFPCKGARTTYRMNKHKLINARDDLYVGTPTIKLVEVPSNTEHSTKIQREGRESNSFGI